MVRVSLWVCAIAALVLIFVLGWIALALWADFS